MSVELSNVLTILAALATIEVGKRLNALVPWLGRHHIPPAVGAGLLLSLVLALLRHRGIANVTFSTGPRDVLLLVFFASLGFGAHLGRLASAGRGALVICLATFLLIVSQNAAGIGVARLFGEAAALGPFLGSIAFVGGHGTVTAWSQAPVAQALTSSFAIGIGGATLGLVLGGLVAGPVAGWLAGRHGARASEDNTATAAATAEVVDVVSPFESDRWIPCLMWILLALAAGPALREFAAARGLAMPGFLAVLLVGVAITNVADAVRRPLDTAVTDLVGTIALRIFLAIAMLSLDWIQLVDHLPMLLTGAAVQVAVTVALALVVIYPLFGRGLDAATACGGFIGFGLGAMPVGLAVMRRLNARYGDTPRALLAITLAASLFTDTANALTVNAILDWLHG